MAPEQFQDAASTDARSDLYAFGIVLYEMITGHRPFRGGSLALWRHAHESFTPRPLAPLIDRRYRRHADAIDHLVQRCLRKTPSERPPSPAALRRDVTRLLSQL
jgi:serine/threonine-protein kinase